MNVPSSDRRRRRLVAFPFLVTFMRLSPGFMAIKISPGQAKGKMPPRKTGKPVPEAVAFGKRVRTLRTAQGMSQEELAEAAGLHSVQISHIEGGRNEVKLTTILRLAKAFKMTASELLKPFK